MNLNAILDAYRHGDIKVIDDQVTVWFAGRLVIGAIDRHKLQKKDLIDKVAEWREKYGPGRVGLKKYIHMNILSVYRVSDLLLAHPSLSPKVELFPLITNGTIRLVNSLSLFANLWCILFRLV